MCKNANRLCNNSEFTNTYAYVSIDVVQAQTKGVKMNNPELKYLDRIDELEHLSIIRLKGNIDASMIPLIEQRIQHNRKRGSSIDKNVLIDYSKVDDVDTATIAFHLVRLKEYEERGYKIGFVHISKKLQALLEMFNQLATFKIYSDERQAIRDLNQ